MLRSEAWARQILRVVMAEDEFGSGVVRSKIRSGFKDVLNASGSDLGKDHDNIVDYHLHLLETTGYVKITPSSVNGAYDKIQLTWAGHDYLEQ
ncbi:hypothetical protein [Pseudomonas alloputida]|uniref:hypothetical protein n=1 Tax=Pseudomonas alloputida TaxID=1940621 RepID=UPI002ACCD6EA|nr:hypothetical protein [Pseudomonas putida]